MGPLCSTPFIAFLAINHGNNGWSEAWHLLDKDIASARATVAELALARSYLLASGHVIEWAAVRQVGIGPYIEWAAITDPLQPLPQWGTCHADHIGLLWRFQTADGKWANHLFRGVDDADIEDQDWIYRGLQPAAGIVPLAAAPELCTRDNLYEHVISVFREKTCHARKVDPDDPSDPWHVLTAWEDVIFRKVSKRNVGSRYNRVSWEATDWTQSPGFTPCGTVVSVLRSCYYADCRFFSAGPTQSILYYNAQPGAAVFDLQSIFWGHARDKEIANATDPGEDTGPGARSYSLGLSWGSAPGLTPDGTQEQFLGLSIPPWGNDPDTPLIYRIPCDMPAPIPITVDDDPGIIVVSNVTHLTFHEEDFTLEEVAPGWARPRIKWQRSIRDINGWRHMGTATGNRAYVAGLNTNTFNWDFVPTAHLVYTLPLLASAGGRIDKVLFEVIIAGSSDAVCRIGLYQAVSSEDLRPNKLLLGSDDVDCSSVGVKEIDCCLVLKPGILYWLAIQHNDSSVKATIAGQTSIDFYPIWGVPATSLNTSASHGHTAAYAYTAMIDPYPWNFFLAYLVGSPSGPTPKLAVHFESSDLSEDELCTHPVINIVFEITATITTYTPDSASMSPVIELTFEPDIIAVGTVPSSTSMTPEIIFELSPESVMAGTVPDSASMAPAIEFTLETTATTSVITSQTRSPGGYGTLADGDSLWSNGGNIFTADGSYATCTLTTGDDHTDSIVAGDFGFTIPGGATIAGYIARILWKQDNSGALQDQIIELRSGGITVSANKAAGNDIPDPDAVTTWGASNDTWTAALTPADVNAADFQLRVRVSVTVPPTSETVHIDHVEMTVYYAE